MITDNYIKMCEQADEIQEEWLPIIGDLAIYNNKIPMLIRFKKTVNNINKDIVKWLPTLEQLQEMNSLLCNFPCQILTFFNDWIKENKIYLSVWGSMNELWLAFVMHECWNKVWTGEKWVIRIKYPISQGW